jgi:hypothetical protein
MLAYMTLFPPLHRCGTRECGRPRSIFIYRWIIRLPSDQDSSRRHVQDYFFHRWGSYQYTVILFELKNAPTIFSRVVIVAFKEFIHQFLEVYLDDWTVYSLLKDHVEVLRVMLERCRQCQISLNIKKCIFGTPFGILLGHIVCK